MILHSPFKIGSRLLPCVQVGGAQLSLEFVGCDQDRMVFRWFVDLDGREYSEADLKSGVQGCSTQQMFGTFLAFLSACGESYRYADGTGREGENADLFPPEVAEWAAQHYEEISSLQMEIEESGEALIED